MAYPTIPITDKQFKYTPACKTDVRETWKKAGWPFPAPGQIKRAITEHERALLEIRQEKADRMALIRDAEDALW